MIGMSVRQPGDATPAGLNVVESLNIDNEISFNDS
jgi:hypothetical protein